MNWPGDDAISAMFLLPQGYRAEHLKRSDISALIAAIAEDQDQETALSAADPSWSICPRRQSLSATAHATQ